MDFYLNLPLGVIVLLYSLKFIAPTPKRQPEPWINAVLC